MSADPTYENFATTGAEVILPIVGLEDDTIDEGVREIIGDSGAVTLSPTGGDDDTAAFVAAWDRACQMARPHLSLSRGVFKIASLSATLRPVSNMTISGAGMDSTEIRWTNEIGQAVDRLIGTNAGATTYSNITIEGIHFKGSHDTDSVEAQHFPILLYNVTGLNFRNNKISYSRTMAMAVRVSSRITITGNVIENCGRDGINTADCTDVVIANNRISYCDDDAIACHIDSANVNDRGVSISGNIIRFCQGIKVLGANGCSITGNTLEFCMAQGINITTRSTGTEGRNAASGVTITGNVIKNCIDRAGVDNLNQNSPYIAISGTSARSGTLDAIPGENDQPDGTVIDPYDYFVNPNEGSTTTPVPASWNIVISGNSLIRDIGVLANISDLGFGSFYTRAGPVDPDIAEADYLENGISINTGVLKNVIVTDNTFSGLNSGLSFASGSRVVNFKVADNTFFDCAAAMTVSNANHNSIYFDNNIVDLDPFLKHANRKNTAGVKDGTWLADGSPTAILVPSATGVRVRHNVFRNLCRISDQLGSNGDENVWYQDNIVECDPTAIGFNVANKGVGNVPRSGRDFIFTIVDSDPGSATYGNVLNQCFLTRQSIPTTGKYVTGHFVAMNTPGIASGKVQIGWIRVTIGTAHVSGTDWAPCFCTTS
jgi:parallel beta-helix repeat protein